MKELTLLMAGLIFFHAQGIEARNERSKHERLPDPPRSSNLSSEQPAAEHALAVFYVVPSDVAYERSVHQRIIEATQDVHAWYQCASGGLTWKLAFPEIVRVYFADHTREFYRDNGNWWGSLLAEMGSKGLPIWSPGTVAAVWARGAGFWAGAAQWCGIDCGVALLGVEMFPEFNRSEWSGGTCPGEVGVGAWPCTPDGAYAHELGHTVGLPHPYDVPSTHDDAFHSVMQTHWNYPNFAFGSESPWGFLTLERQTLRSNPFMHTDIDLFQLHPGCDVVNLPSSGEAPIADFQLDADGLVLSTTNLSQGGSLYYWTFGDGSVSNELNPIHTYGQSANFPVALRVSGDNSVIDLAQGEAALGACPSFIAKVTINLGPLANDDALTLLSTLTPSPTSNGVHPPTEDVTLWVGRFHTTIPAGSFKPAKGRQLEFDGILQGVNVKARIRPLGKSRFRITVDANGAELAGLESRSAIGLTIGDDSWCGAVAVE